MCREPFSPPPGVTCVWHDIYASCRRPLPLLHRSYGLMRQTKTLLPPSASAWSAGLCPAGRDWEMALPDLIPAIRAEVPGPLPRDVLPVPVPASSWKAMASSHASQVRHTDNAPCTAPSTGLYFSGLPSFHCVQAPTLARPQGCTHR
jgi:hypothetical protein